MKVKKLSHIAVMVKDLDEANKLFADLFGIEFGAPFETKDTDTKGVLSPLGIELVSPLTSDGPAAQALERRGEGFALLALDVPNIEEAIADMESHGVRLIGRANLPVGKTASFHPKDLHGIMIELIER